MRIPTVGEVRQILEDQNMFHWLGDKVQYVAYDSDGNVSPVFKDAGNYRESVDFLLSMGCDYLWIFKADGTFMTCYDKDHRVVSVEFDGVKDLVDLDYGSVVFTFNKDFTVSNLQYLYNMTGDEMLVPVISNGKIEGLERFGGVTC